MNGVSLRVVCLLGTLLSCKDRGNELRLSAPISSDGELFSHITRVDPFSTYNLFPNVDSATSGTLNGSTAHQPLVSVRLNGIATNTLQNGRFPAGSSFPDGSVIFKQIISGGQTSLYAVMYKDAANPLAGNGWLWAEFYPDGSPFISLARKGANCTACHSREQGLQHDLVRTFERQH